MSQGLEVLSGWFNARPQWGCDGGVGRGWGVSFREPLKGEVESPQTYLRSNPLIYIAESNTIVNSSIALLTLYCAFTFTLYCKAGVNQLFPMCLLGSKMSQCIGSQTLPPLCKGCYTFK